jgi:hypothetical protein
MKNSKVLSIAFILFLSICNFSFSQNRFFIQLYGGFSIPFAQLAGDIGSKSSSVFEGNYGMQIGINGGLQLKYAIDEKERFRAVAGIDGNAFLNLTGALTLGLVEAYRPTIGITTYHLGGEYAFSPEKKLTTLLGAAFTINKIDGKHIETATRYGFQLCFSADYALTKHFGITGGLKCNFANLFGKKSNTTKFGGKYPEYPLNDGDYVYQGQKISSKNIFYFQMYLGIEFIIGGSGRGKTKVVK